MDLYKFNPSLAAISLPIPDQLKQAVIAQAQAQQAAQPQNPGVTIGDVPQPIPPVGSPGGPTTVGPATWMTGQNAPQYANVPLPPPRPTSFGNSAGAGVQALHNNLTGGGSIPLPPPRPQNLTPPQSANQLLQANAAPDTWGQIKHSPIENLLHLFGYNGGGLGQGLGGAISSAGHVISNGLGGVFSGLFNPSGNDPSSDHAPFI